MNLFEYTNKHGAQADLARKVGVVTVCVNQWASGARKVPVARCIDIERATEGAVTCEELRPDLADRWAYLRGTEKGAA
jgi:DNA-binding transcriptional regulator YdaS (Cro superfamily)